MKTSAAVRAALKGYDPTEEQWLAIAHPLEPVYLVAGAGAGKTAIMAARIAWIIENKGIAPSQILGLTFTNKAAGELEERVNAALDVIDDAHGSWSRGEATVQTYNAFAASIVRDHGLLVGVEAEAGLLSEAQQWQLVLTCINDLPAFDAIELRTAATLVRSTLALASAVADHVITVADVEAAADGLLSSKSLDEESMIVARRRKELCRAVAAYQVAKQRHGRIDFSDQITKAVEILEGHSLVRRSYQERFPIVLLDEYQDTNVAQRRLIQALVPRGGAVTAVGDARQAIYAFRGATMYNLIGFPGHFPRKEGTYGEISLSENFRSGSRILEVANDIVSRIPEARRPGAPLHAYPDNGEGRVALGLFSDERSEAEWIASECERLHQDAPKQGKGTVAWRDIGVLVRRKAAMAAIIEALDKRDIPVEIVGLGGLLQTPEVIEVVAWLRCLDTKPAANRWAARVLLGPRWRVHYRDLARCARWAADRNYDLKLRLAGGDEELANDMEPGDVGFSLLEACAHAQEIEGLGPEARRRLVDFEARLARLRKRATAPLLELVQEVILETGLGDALEASTARSAPAARQNLAALLDHVAAFSPVEGDADLRSLLAYLDAADDAEETLEATQPAAGDSVKLMTIHAAKGLEFECVFVPSVSASKNANDEYVYSIFPNERASNPLTSYTELPYEVREDKDYMPRFTGKLGDFKKAVKERVREDERRLFYVALTRARQSLSVTAAWWYGRDKRSKGPSLFWDEVRVLEERGLLEVVVEAEEPLENPLFGALESRRAWPPEARPGADDPLFEQGWGAAAEAVIEGDQSLETLTEGLPTDQGVALVELRSRLDAELALIEKASSAGESDGVKATRIISATDFIGLEQGAPGARSVARSAPERPSAARRLGTEVHRAIEEHSRARNEPLWTAAPFPEEDELDEPMLVGGDDEVQVKLARWAELGFGDRAIGRLPSGEPMIEIPFSLRVGDDIVRGRIDAVYETDDGGFEIVDFKTGGRFEPGEIDQLAVYARALVANGLVPEGGSVILTYAFLDGGDPLTRPYSG
ncbi:MAG: ATP-dependent helicase [Actinobacteria bacterium]|nr:ATP-dependent helicase [Actinomycetota bacterium]